MDSSRLTFTANVVDVDIVTARHDFVAGINAQSDVEPAGHVVIKRKRPDGRVVVASVDSESTKSVSCVAVADFVAIKGFIAGGRVVDAGCVDFERLRTAGRVAGAGGVIQERVKTDCGIAGAGCIAYEFAGATV